MAKVAIKEGIFAFTVNNPFTLPITMPQVKQLKIAANAPYLSIKVTSTNPQKLTVAPIERSISPPIRLYYPA
jgi:hypothetical protein